MNKTIFSCLAAFVLLSAGTVFPGEKSYSGNGISFNYPDRYNPSSKTLKSGEQISLKDGQNSITVRVNNNRLAIGFEDAVIRASAEELKKKGYVISETRKEQKAIPLNVKGQSEKIRVDSTKYNHVAGIETQNTKIFVKQTLFFFSYGDHGYIVNFTRASATYDDLKQVLSSFTFDQADNKANPEDEGDF